MDKALRLLLEGLKLLPLFETAHLSCNNYNRTWQEGCYEVKMTTANLTFTGSMKSLLQFFAAKTKGLQGAFFAAKTADLQGSYKMLCCTVWWTTIWTVVAVFSSSVVVFGSCLLTIGILSAMKIRMFT